MRLSRYFVPTIKENPSEAAIVSHRFMLRAGMIRQSVSGIYTWLPLGLRVLTKIENIIREEQELAGASEVRMSTIQTADLWKESGRYEDYGDEMLRINDRHGRELLYGPTNEEVITDLFRKEVKSWKQLPTLLYQIQLKFRDEIRPRFGLMRGREFTMKDAYSFDIDEENSVKSYYRMFVSYLRIFNKMGIRAIPMKADTGPIGGNLSHEFLLLAETGESEVYCHKDFLEMDIPDNVDYDGDLSKYFQEWTSKYAATDEMYVEEDAKKFGDDIIKTRGIEVGHVFNFGTKYSEPLHAVVMNKEGKEIPVHMGSYGIGVSRCVAGIIEASHDDKGIIWPVAVAPFEMVVLDVKPKDEESSKVANDIYKNLKNHKLDVAIDDRNDRVGSKFADMDLIGIPLLLVVGPRGLLDGHVKLVSRKSGNSINLSVEEVQERIIKAKSEDSLQKFVDSI